MIGHDLMHPTGVADLSFVESNAWLMLEGSDVGPLASWVVVIVEIINTDHLIPAARQGFGQMAADKTSGTGHEHIHWAPSL